MHDPLYRHNILDHYRNPRHFGILKKYTHEAGHQNISCGDALQFQVLVEKGKIKELAFTGAGCAISIAAASMTAEALIGKPLSALQKMEKKEIETLLKTPLSSARILCAMLGLETLKKLRTKRSK